MRDRDLRGLQSIQASRRQFLGWGAFGAGAIALGGCGAGTPVAETGPALGEGYTGPPIQIEYWNGFTGGDGPAMRDLVAAFNESQDRITVRMNVVQWAQYYQRVIAAVHAGQGPDVGAMHLGQLATQAARQTVSPLDDEVLADLGVSADQYPDEVWQAGEFQGQRYGIPLDVHSLGNYANLDLLSQGGVEPGPMDREQYESSLAGLADAGVETPFWIPNRWPAHLMFLSLIWQFGGEPYAEDGSKATFDSDAGIAALEWMRAQVDAGVSPPDVAPDSQYTAFKNGEGAFTWDGIWQINDLKATAPDLNWGLVPVPTIGEQPAVWADSHQLVMFRSRTPDDNRLLASKTFLKFLVENSDAWAAAGMIPARAEARETPAFQESPQAPIGEIVDTMRFLPPVPALGEVQVQTLEVAVSNGVLGNAEPAEALKAAAAQATQLMQANLAKFER